MLLSCQNYYDMIEATGERLIMDSTGIGAGLLAIALTALPFPAFGFSDVLWCQIKDAVRLQDDGTLERDRTAERFHVGDKYIVNVSTGELIINDGGSVQWEIVKRGDSENDTVLSCQKTARRLILFESNAKGVVRIV
jgi:hypothetical protein